MAKNEPSQDPQEDAVSTDGLTWEQKMLRARQDMAASRANPKAEEAVGEVLELTGISILPMRDSMYKDCTEKATAFCSDGRAYDFYSLAGVTSARTLLGALGPVWDGHTVRCKVESIHTSHGDRPVLALV